MPPPMLGRQRAFGKHTEHIQTMDQFFATSIPTQWSSMQPEVLLNYLRSLQVRGRPLTVNSLFVWFEKNLDNPHIQNYYVRQSAKLRKEAYLYRRFVDSGIVEDPM